MNSIELDVTYNKYHCHLEFHRRISIIRGDSAIGKTSLIDMVSNPLTTVVSTYPIDIAGSNGWFNTMIGATDTIIFFDDMTIVESARFADAVSKYCSQNNLWLVVMDRSLEFGGGKLSYAVDSIYDMFNDGNTEYWIEPEFPVDFDRSKQFDTILVEDSSGGYQFFNRNLPDIAVHAATDGKATIVDDAMKIVSERSNILIFADVAAFGCHIDDLMCQVLKRSEDTQLVWFYECFEELLLRTNLLNHNPRVVELFNNLVDQANANVSWEKFFEKFIEDLTDNTFCKYVHGNKLYDCYFKDCEECNSYIKAKCPYVLEGDKLEALVKETPYEFLLDLRNGKPTKQEEFLTNNSSSINSATKPLEGF